jgi:hypothetical protein
MNGRLLETRECATNYRSWPITAAEFINVPTTSITRLRYAAAAPLYRTFPIAIKENKGCSSMHSENILRNGRRVFEIRMHSWTPRGEPAGVSRQQFLKIGTQLARATAVLSIIVIPSLSSAAIYKCIAQDGGITYTDQPCPADTTRQYIDAAMLVSLNESSQSTNTAPAFRDAKSQSQPEIIAALCADDEFRVWLKAQRHSFPERDTRTAKFIELSYLCRRALHLPDVAAPISQTP